VVPDDDLGVAAEGAVGRQLAVAELLGAVLVGPIVALVIGPMVALEVGPIVAPVIGPIVVCGCACPCPAVVGIEVAGPDPAAPGA